MLAGLADGVGRGIDLGAGMKKARVWQNRQAIVRSCISRHPPAKFLSLLKRLRRADAAAKGQLRADPWQLVMHIALELALPAAAAA